MSDTLSIPFGHGTIDLHLPGDMVIDWIEPAYVSPAPDPLNVVQDAIEHPIDGLPLSATRGVKSVVIAINDKTRPVPYEHLLPPLLTALVSSGINESDISFLVATGTHIPMTTEEMFRLVPVEIAEKYRILSHNCDNLDELVTLGTTSRGTPVSANRYFLEADLRIVIGNIEPHHFAGFSGGYKTAAIGLTGRQTITQNHSLLVEPGAEIGIFEDNPLRQDIEEIGDMMGVQVALNAILNGEKSIVKALCGSPRAVFQAGIPISQAACQVRMPGSGMKQAEKYDLVIASAGGAPKDINFYQAQKALTHAALFVRPGGVIILAAECEEGVGSAGYEDFMRGIQSTDEVFARFRSLGFRVGPHKALLVARIARLAQILLISNIPPEVVSGLLMIPAATIDEAMTKAIEKLSPTLRQPLRAVVLPRATTTIPIF